MAKQKRKSAKEKPDNSFLLRISKPPYGYLIIVSALVLIYLQVVSFYLGKLDEPGIILNNLRFLTDFSNFREALFRDAFFSHQGVEFYRPVQNISFMIDAHISGSSAWGYYLMNLFFHSVSCCLLFYLLILFDPGRKTAFAVSLFFAVNPLFAGLIPWAPSRGDLLIVCFGLLSYISFKKYLGSGKIKFILLNVLCFFLAMFSKETAILFPLVFMADYFLLNQKKPKGYLKAIVPFFLQLLIILFYFFMRNQVVKSTTPTTIFGLIPLLYNWRTFLEYIGTFIFPFSLSPMPAYTFINTGLGIAVLIILIYVLIRYKFENYRLFIFGAFWYLLFILPGMMYSHGMGNAAYDYLEHRSYLPLIGFAIIIFFILIQLGKQFRNSTLNYIVVILAFIFGFYSFIYAKNFANSQTFYSLAVRTNPGSAMAFADLGRVAASFKDFESAMADYDQAIKIKPDYAEVYVDRGGCYFELNKKEEARNDFLTAIKLKPDLFHAHFNLATLDFAMGRLQEALKEYNQTIKINPYYPNAYLMRGRLYIELKDYKSAIQDFSQHLTYFTDSQETYILRGKCRYWISDKEGACTDWRKARNLGSDEASALINKFCK